MPLVSSPVLLDHAIGAVFADFGKYPVTYVRAALTVIREKFGDAMPVATVVNRCLPGASLKQSYTGHSLAELWTVLDAHVEDQRQTLCRQFAELVATAAA